jgi:glycosyltransferase involved in cell wall biosynthesis
MVKISVIVPIYNVEKYLAQCLEHIINQTFEDIEIICIDDGSTDNSPKILDEFAKKDERIKIISQKNRGLGATRNRGIEVAKGDYIYFMDGDDYLELTALEELYEISKKHCLDFAIFKINNFEDETGEPIIDEYYSMPYLKRRVGDNVFNYADVADIALKLAVNTYGNFFKREFVLDLRFPEGLLFEDNVFFAKSLFKAERVYFHDRFLYNRRVRKDSLSNAFSIGLLDTIDITDLLLDLTNEYGYDQYKNELYYRIFHNIYSIFEGAPDDCKSELFFEIKRRYLKFSDKWQSDDYFRNDLAKSHKNIYESAIESHSSEEFESRVKIYDLERKINKLKRENRKIEKKLNKIKKENDAIRSTKGFRLTKKQ